MAMTCDAFIICMRNDPEHREKLARVGTGLPEVVQKLQNGLFCQSALRDSKKANVCRIS